MLESPYIYKTALSQPCYIQKDCQNGKYYVCVGRSKKFGGYFYDTAEDAQSALDIMASRLGWKHDKVQGRH